MTQSPVTVTYSLEEILKEIKQGLDTLHKEVREIRQKDIPDLKLSVVKLEAEMTAVKEDIKEIKGNQDTLIKDVSDLKGAKSLIIPIVVAVTTSLVTLLIRSLPNP